MTVQQELSASSPDGAGGRPAQVRLLGPFELQRSDGTVVDVADWRTGRARDLVRLLALQDGTPVPAALLVAALWPAADPVRGHASLRTAASEARKVLGGRHIERTLGGLRLRNTWVDVTRFRALAVRARRDLAAGRFPEAFTAAREAVDLYRGEFRAHDRTADWARGAARSLAVTAVEVAGDAAEAALALGRPGPAVDLARGALQWDAFDERASRLLMRALADSGRMSAAMWEYERCRTVLADELGIDPSPETRAVHRALLRAGADPDLPATPVPPDPPVDRDPGSAAAILRRVRDVHLPRREFTAARRLTGEIGRQTTDPGTRARALVLEVVPDVLGGNVTAAAAGLRRARAVIGTAADTVVGRRIDVLELLLSHDTAADDFDDRWADAVARCRTETDVNWGWCLVRIATERGALDAAAEAARLSPAPGAGPLARQLRTLALAGWEVAIGRGDDGARRLRAWVTAESTSLSALVLPEALAIAATAAAADDVTGTDVDGARTLLRRLDTLAGEGNLMPRERCLQSLAIAAVRAAEGRHAAATATAAAAADLAESTGLVWPGARAREVCLVQAQRARDAAGTPTTGILRLPSRIA